MSGALKAGMKAAVTVPPLACRMLEPRPDRCSVGVRAAPCQVTHHPRGSAVSPRRDRMTRARVAWRREGTRTRSQGRPYRHHLRTPRRHR